MLPFFSSLSALANIGRVLRLGMSRAGFEAPSSSELSEDVLLLALSDLPRPRPLPSADVSEFSGSGGVPVDCCLRLRYSEIDSCNATRRSMMPYDTFERDRHFYFLLFILHFACCILHFLLFTFHFSFFIFHFSFFIFHFSFFISSFLHSSSPVIFESKISLDIAYAALHFH
jgi:hypothetical protein